MKKIKPKVNLYRVINDLVERGVERGWQRAHKHTSKPSEDYIKEQLEECLMFELCEYLDFK